MKGKVISLALIAGAIALGDPFQEPAAPDFGGLYDRLSSSTFVVRGRLLSTVTVASNRAKNEYGTLYVVGVDQTVCRQANFRPRVSQAVDAGRQIRIFVPNREPMFKPRAGNSKIQDRKESLVPDVDYLLFLERDPKESQIRNEYGLEPGIAYYRTAGGMRGALEFPALAAKGSSSDWVTPVADAVNSMCKAVESADIREKLNQLAGLQKTADPAWRDSVEAAFRALQSESR